DGVRVARSLRRERVEVRRQRLPVFEASDVVGPRRVERDQEERGPRLRCARGEDADPEQESPPEAAATGSRWHGRGRGGYHADSPAPPLLESVVRPRALVPLAPPLAFPVAISGDVSDSPAPAPNSATPPASAAERQADLERLQRRISVLKSKLAEGEKKTATLTEELSQLELRLEIATREGELVAATRVEFASRLAAVTAERAAAAASAAQSRQALLARARLLHRFGRFGYFRVLLEAHDLPAFMSSVERLDSLARRDGRLLKQHRDAEERLQTD